MTLSCKGKIIARDEQGFLENLDDWNDEVARQLAAAEHIELTEAHWEIIALLKQFYKEYELSPAMRPLINYIRQNLEDNKANSIYLMKLFPGSPAKIAAKIAGLPKPENCL